VINTQRLSEDKAVDLICDGVKDRNLVEEKSNSKRILTDLILCKKAEIAVLKLDEVEGEHFSLTAENGKVTITGHVHSKYEHKAVINAVKNSRASKRSMINCRSSTTVTNRTITDS